MAKIQDIINILETMFPPNLAESWDKIGLQVGNPRTPVKKIFLALDVTETAVREAIRQRTNLIISHHPFIFDPIASLVDSETHTRIISLLLKNKISVYVAHTNLDFALGGTCHSLAEELKLQNIRGLSPVYEQQYKKIVVFVPATHLEKVSQAMFHAGAGIIGDYSSCSYRIEGTGTFKGSKNTNPYLGKAGQLETMKETRLETLVPATKLQDVLKAMSSVHPYEEVAYDIYPLENPHPQASKGVIGTLSKVAKLDSWAKKVKSLLRLKGLRVIGKPEQRIRTVAVVTGSGSDFIIDAVREKCDALMTGDMKYHQALHTLDLGLAVLDIGHYPSEARYMPVLAKRLNKTFKSMDWKIPIVVSKAGSDPFSIFLISFFMPKIPAERIVLRSPNWLGDAMMMTPAVTALRQLYPQSHITIVTKTSLVDVWSVNPHISEVIQLPRSRSAKNIYQFSQVLQEKKFDVGILFTNSISSALEFAWAKIPCRLGTPNGIRRFLLTDTPIKGYTTKHTGEQYLELVRHLGEVPQTPDMLFPISDESRKSAERFLQEITITSSDKVIGINPGAAFGTAKRWLPERFIELANELAKEPNTKIVLFGGKEESQDIQKMAVNIKPNAINLAGKTTLGELGACISRCNLFVTNDSGPMHIASALGVPMVAIFGSTNLKSTGPIGKGKIEIVQNPPECAPCLLRECPIDHRCMTVIKTSDVLQACKNLLV